MASSSPKRVNLHGSGIPERHHMNERSFYEEHAAPLALPPLQGEHRAGVAIVGGGLAGLSTAASLLARGVRDLVLLEAEQLGSGASGRNGGFVMEGFSLSPQALLRQLGAEAARSLYGASRDAVALVRQRIVEHGIDCQRTEGGALWLDWFDTPASRQRMQAHAGLLRERFGVEWDAVDREQVRRWLDSPRYGGALWERGAFHFQPLRYVRGLAVALQSQGLRICEASPVRELVQHGSGWRLQTGTGVLHAEQVLLAGGATLRGVHAGVERARLPIATYVVCSEPLAPVRQVIHTDAALYDNRFAFDYYRRLQDGRILWGGRISIRERRPEAIAALLKRDLLRVFPQLHDLRLTHAWGGLMSYARHEMPQVLQLRQGLWAAQGFGGHGMAPTALAGEWLADALLGRPLPQALRRYGLQPVYGAAGLLAAQARYSWAELQDWLSDPRR